MDQISETAREGTAMTHDAALHLAVDGIPVRAQGMAGTARVFAVHAGARDIRIMSRSAVPAQLGLTRDIRRLGVHVTRIRLEAPGVLVDVATGHAAFAQGWHGVEGSSRWTDGAARLPAILHQWIGAPFTMALHLSRTDLRYPAGSLLSAPQSGHAARRGLAALCGCAAAEEAVRAFAADVMPFARILIPGLDLRLRAIPPHAAGAGPAVDAVLPDPGTDPLAAMLERHRILVVPLPAGSSAEARASAEEAVLAGLAHGIAVVAAPEPAASLGLSHERHLLVATDATAFAMAIARLDGDAPLWGRLSEAGQAWCGDFLASAPLRAEAADRAAVSS